MTLTCNYCSVSHAGSAYPTYNRLRSKCVHTHHRKLPVPKVFLLKTWGQVEKYQQYSLVQMSHWDIYAIQLGLKD